MLNLKTKARPVCKLIESSSTTSKLIDFIGKGPLYYVNDYMIDFMLIFTILSLCQEFQPPAIIKPRIILLRHIPSIVPLRHQQPARPVHVTEQL